MCHPLVAPRRRGLGGDANLALRSAGSSPGLRLRLHLTRGVVLRDDLQCLRGDGDAPPRPVASTG